jgi:hypothetical protein
VQASSILLSDGSLLFVTDQPSLFVADPPVHGTVDLTILFPVVTVSQNFSWCNRSVLHIGLDGVGGALCLLSSGVERCFSDQLVPVQGLAVSIPREDLYWIGNSRRLFVANASFVRMAQNADGHGIARLCPIRRAIAVPRQRPVAALSRLGRGIPSQYC